MRLILVAANWMGDGTDEQYALYKYNGRPRPEFMPTCNLTNATGPYDGQW